MNRVTFFLGRSLHRAGFVPGHAGICQRMDVGSVPCPGARFAFGLIWCVELAVGFNPDEYSSSIRFLLTALEPFEGFLTTALEPLASYLKERLQLFERYRIHDECSSGWD